jgi:hypothetical protein
VYSLSAGAIRRIQQAGSARITATGGVMWKLPNGETLDQLYARISREDDATG